MSDEAPTVVAEVRGGGLVGCTPRTYVLALQPGAGVLLEREPTNPVHYGAIRVLAGDKETCVGYVDWESADRIAPWIDKGWMYTARVVRCAHIVRRGRRLYVHPNATIRCVPLPPIRVSVRARAQEPA